MSAHFSANKVQCFEKYIRMKVSAVYKQQAADSSPAFGLSFSIFRYWLTDSSFFLNEKQMFSQQKSAISNQWALFCPKNFQFLQ